MINLILFGKKYHSNRELFSTKWTFQLFLFLFIPHSMHNNLRYTMHMKYMMWVTRQLYYVFWRILLEISQAKWAIILFIIICCTCIYFLYTFIMYIFEFDHHMRLLQFCQDRWLICIVCNAKDDKFISFTVEAFVKAEFLFDGSTAIAEKEEKKDDRWEDE